MGSIHSSRGKETNYHKGIIVVWSSVRVACNIVSVLHVFEQCTCQ